MSMRLLFGVLMSASLVASSDSTAHSSGLKDGFVCGRAAGIWLVFDAQHNAEGMASAKKIFINGGCVVLMKGHGIHNDLLKSLEAK